MSGRINSATVVGLGLCGVGLLAVGFALQISPDADGGYGARTFPITAAAGLFLLGLLEARRGLFAEIEPPESTKNLSSIAALIILTVAYVWLMTKLGYLISTGVVAPVALWLFGIRNPIGLILSVVLCPVVYHMLFFELLGVFPPYGDWFDLLDILQL